MAIPDSHDIYESLGMTGENEPADDSAFTLTQIECTHVHTRINLELCAVQCTACGEVLTSLNVFVDRVLRVQQ